MRTSKGDLGGSKFECKFVPSGDFPFWVNKGHGIFVNFGWARVVGSCGKFDGDPIIPPAGEGQIYSKISHNIMRFE